MVKPLAKLKKLRGRSLDELRTRGAQLAACLAERAGLTADARLPGDAEFRFRVTAVDVLRRVEAAEVLADDLTGPVALEPLGAGVPTHHLAGGIQQADRVILHRIDEQPELLVPQP